MAWSQVLLLGALVPLILGQYQPNWDSLDSRPLPDWYDKAKIGIFIHWGVFSVPSVGNEWFWWNWQNNDENTVRFMRDNYAPSFTYQDFGPALRAEFFNPDQWVDIFAKSGAKYLALTSKHHEGYTLWPSKYSFSWNSQEVGPHRDLVGDLADAVRRNGQLRFGLYHSLYEWYNPLYLQDQANEWTTTDFVDTKIWPELKELITTYQPEVLWSDGDWEAPDSYWRSTELLAWLYNESPVRDTVVTNDRWGSGIMCNHGDYITCADRYSPGVLQAKKWENAMTLDRYSWGYRRQMTVADVLSEDELLQELVKTVSCGGNILINVGPTKEGTIDPIFQERLLNLGSWLEINGEAIYESVPWTAQNDTLTPNVWYTARDNAVYAIVLDWPENDLVILESIVDLVSARTRVELLGHDGDLNWVFSDHDGHFTLDIILPQRETVTSEWAWTLRLTE